MARGQQTLPYVLRPMSWEDLTQVTDIEREAFPSLWPRTSYQRELHNRQAEYSVIQHRDERILLPPMRRGRGLMDVLRRRRREPAPRQAQLLVGYVGLWYMAGEGHIVSIAVREGFRRQGIGGVLLIGAIEMALRREMEILTLEVRISNEPAIALYEKYGLRQVGLRKGYYSDNHEDAIIMSTDSLRSGALLASFHERIEKHEERYGDAERQYL